MLRKLLVVLVGMVVLGVFVGGPTVINVFRTGRARIQKETRDLGLVSPEVELESAMRDATTRLPEELGRLRQHLGEVEKELVAQTRTQQEYRDGLRLIESDLKQLAGAVQKNEGCTLLGRQRLSASQARTEAGRLLHRRKTYQGLIEGRERLIVELREKRSTLDKAVADAENAMADVRTRRDDLAAKISVLKAAQSVNALREITSPSSVGVLSSLAELDRDVERRLVVEDAKGTMSSQARTPDPYLQAVQQSNVEEELTRLFPPDKETAK